MSKTGQKSKSAKAERTRKPADQPWGNYVYCIVESSNLEGILDRAPEGLETAQNLELVSSAGFSAVVSLVPLSEYGEQALDANLCDVKWAASRVMCHEGVVEYFASRRAVIPLRFGTIYVDRKSIGRMLAERARELGSLIERLRGREEWGVLIYCDQSKLIEHQMAGSSTIRHLLEREKSATPGQSYLLSKQIEGLKAKAAREEILSAVDAMKYALVASSEQSGSTSDSMRRRPEQPDLIARLSFLVQTKLFDEFRSTAERLAKTYLSSGFRLELVGPLPPYSFVLEPGTREPVP
jgi:hypothetical protein